MKFIQIHQYYILALICNKYYLILYQMQYLPLIYEIIQYFYNLNSIPLQILKFDEW